jgi:hypothetical protein
VTLKEAHEKSRDGQELRRMGGNQRSILKQKQLFDPKYSHYFSIRYEDAIADDWEIIGDKKRIVIDGGSMGKDFSYEETKIIKGTKVRMTIEWDEP